MKRLMLSFAFVCLLLTPTSPAAFSGTAPIDDKPKVGELRIDGVVSKVDSVMLFFVMRAESFTTTSGRTAPITPAKDKVVRIDPDVVWIDKDDPGNQVTLAKLSADARAVVLGKDGGSGEPITARVVIVSGLKKRSIFERLPPLVPLPGSDVTSPPTASRGAPAAYPSRSAPRSTATSTSSGACRSGGSHVSGKRDKKGKLHCKKCGQYM